MKGFAIRDLHKQKDAYDIYCCVRNYPGGIATLAADCQPLLTLQEARDGYRCVAEKFHSPDAYGPTCVRRFVEDTQLLGDRTADQWQQDAFGQVDAWLRAMGLQV